MCLLLSYGFYLFYVWCGVVVVVCMSCMLVVVSLPCYTAEVMAAVLYSGHAAESDGIEWSPC